jgi:hypothetical protein
MSFRVIYNSATVNGIGSVSRDTPAEALERASELIQQGFRSVMIRDRDGKIYSVDSFKRLHFETKH